MGRLSIRSPATWTDCLDMAGGRSMMRKALLWQRSNGDSVAILDDGLAIAIAFLVPTEAGEIELALSLRAGARERMLSLCRFAHLTLASLADTGAVVICHVASGNEPGHRMARLAGFVPDGVERWKWGKDDASCEGTVRRRRKFGGIGGGGEKPPAAAGGE